MTAPTPPDYSAWKYRATIRITNPTTTAGYQHLLTLTWKPGMRSDFRDIRFTERDGTNCPYWIESQTDRSTATVWIKVPSASQGLIFLYYGNGAAASESSGDDTFEFFDDFSGSALDTDIWQGDTGYATVSGGKLTYTSGTTTERFLLSKTTWAENVAFRSKSKFCGNASLVGSDIMFRKTDISNYFIDIYYINSSNKIRAYSGTGGTSTTNADTNENIYEIRWLSGNAAFFKNGSAMTNSPRTTTVPSVACAAGFSNAGTSAYKLEVDWALVRKYAATEPTLTAYFTGVNPLLPRRGLHGITLSTGTEYSFDAVNVDHGMVAGIGAQEIELTTNVNHSMTPGANAQELSCGAVNIYHPIYPTAAWAQVIENPTTDTGDLISVTVSRSMDDPMWQAVFEYAGSAVGNYFSGDCMTQILVTIPDYLGTDNTVFAGIVPSSRARYSPANDSITMTAVDYGLYLTKQVLETKDLALLPPDDQTSEGANVAKVLSYDGVIKAFQLGMYVVGQITGAAGTIIELAGTATQRMTLYPATGTFQDDEILRVGGVDYAVADGRSVDTSYTPYYEEINPEDWVYSVLGGDNWMRVTGIEPYQIASTAAYWDTEDCPAVPFMFGSTETKMAAIQRLAKYMGFIFLVKPRNVGTVAAPVYRPSAYFIKEADIDSLLDLPAATTITGPTDSYLAAPVELNQDGELQADVVKVACQDLNGNWLTAIRSNSRYDYGEGPYRMCYKEPQDICTHVDLDAYADDLYDLYSARTCTWSATLVDRSDLELYQLLTINGFGTEIPDGSYRIVKISYEYGCAKNLVHITFMLATSFSTLLKYGMTYKDSINEVEQVVAGLESQKPQTELATVTATDGWTLTYETEAGNKGKGRDSTSTPSVAGTTPVGAKVSVQTIRGGVVCIPIVAASSASTDLLVVDVPTITSALVDDDDHNYWDLIWVPGANNQNVSINVQTGSYPSAAGTVTGSGSVTHLYPISTTHVRIRFSGPSTTYYIKLWGERNGVYSATGDEATIVSGSDVTPSDVWEPEPIGVIDELLCAGKPADQSTYDYEVFSGNITYNGTDNLYIGGPVEDHTFDAYPGPQPTPRYFMVDETLIITGPGGTIRSSSPWGWKAPILISGILSEGANAVTITVRDTHHKGISPSYYELGCSDLWIRTYYL